MISKKRQQKEAAIIDAAEMVFFSSGFANAKMEDVAEKVGMSKGSLYFYFKSKEDLYMAITFRAFKLLTDLYYQVIAENKDKDGRDRVIAILSAYLSFSEKHFHYHEALFNYMSLVRNITMGNWGRKAVQGVKDSLYFIKIQDIHNLPVDIVVKEINEGKKDGSIANHQKSEMIYLTAWAIISGYIKLSMYGGRERGTIYHVGLAEWKAYIIDIAGSILDGINQTKLKEIDPKNKN